MVLAVENIDVEHDGRTILRDISLTLKPGTVTAVLGANGAGKSETGSKRSPAFFRSRMEHMNWTESLYATRLHGDYSAAWCRRCTRVIASLPR